MLLKPQEGRDYAYPPSIGPDCFKVTDPVEVATWFKSLFANPRARVWVAQLQPRV